MGPRGNLVLMIVCVAMVIFFANRADAQNMVLCLSLLDGETTAVFIDNCPSGWTFIKHV